MNSSSRLRPSSSGLEQKQLDALIHITDARMQRREKSTHVLRIGLFEHLAAGGLFAGSFGSILPAGSSRKCCRIG